MRRTKKTKNAKARDTLHRGDRVTVDRGGWQGHKGRLTGHQRSEGGYGVEFYTRDLGWLFGGHYRRNQITRVK